ncbi:MAG: hypothetical protein RL368_608 [Pseudomonadota bacterium]|jgi:transposase
MHFIGLEIVKQHIHCTLLIRPHSDKLQKLIENSDEGIQQLLNWAMHLAECNSSALHTVIEANLGYHKFVATRLFKAGCKVSVVHPIFIESFAQRLHLRISPSNQEDILTRYGVTPLLEMPEGSSVHDYHAIKQLHTRKQLLEIDIQREQDRLDSLRKTQVTGLALLSTERTLKHLESEFALISEEMMKFLLRGYLMRVAKSRLSN